MTARDQLPESPLRSATLGYRTLPRDVWALALLRAHQLGARRVAVAVQAAQHATPNGEPDLLGHASPQNDLVGLAQECGRLDLALELELSLAASPNDRREAGAAGREWVAALARALAPYQAPHGPVAALRLPPASAAAEEWLHAAGWRAPIVVAGPAAAASLPGALACATQAHLAARPGPAGPPLLRADGSARPAFWRTHMFRGLLAAAPADFAAAHAPADLALLADRPLDQQPALAALARQLRHDNAAFDTLGLAEATPARLASYRLVVAPAGLTHQPAAARLLAPCANLTLLGPPDEAPAEGFFYKPRLPHPPTAEQLYETIEELGGKARYAWADGAGVSLHLRYGAEYTYLFVDNQRSASYNGTLAYRAPDGAVLHVHVGIGAGRGGVLLLRDDEVIGAAIDGDGAEGGWLARGMHTSAVFSHGAGGVLACGGALVASAPQSGRFQLRTSRPWPAMRAWRLLLGGAALAAPIHPENSHLVLPYIAEDERGQTDCYLAQPEGAPLPPRLREYLATLLHARAAALRAAAALATQAGAASFERAAAELADRAASASIGAYAGAREASDALIAPALAALDPASRHAEQIDTLLGLTS